MAFEGHKNNPNLTIEDCKASKDNWRVWATCQNLKYDDKCTSMSHETYRCAICGRVEYADYDDMR